MTDSSRHQEDTLGEQYDDADLIDLAAEDAAQTRMYYDGDA